MAGIDILVDATWEPVSLALAKKQCQVDSGMGEDDEYFESVLIPAAREHAELHTNRSFMKRTFREYFDGFPGQHLPIPYNVVIDIPFRHRYQTQPSNRFELGRSPLIEVLQIKYLDQNGAEQTLDPSYYTVSDHKEPASIYRTSDKVQWPTPLSRVDSVWVDYTAGYRDPDNEEEEDLAKLPALLLQGMLLLLSHWYENRVPLGAANLAEVPYTIKNALDKKRVYYQA